jgi:hypothetical protein
MRNSRSGRSPESLVRFQSLEKKHIRNMILKAKESIEECIIPDREVEGKSRCQLIDLLLLSCPLRLCYFPLCHQIFAFKNNLRNTDIETDF